MGVAEGLILDVFRTVEEHLPRWRTYVLERGVCVCVHEWVCVCVRACFLACMACTVHECVLACVLACVRGLRAWRACLRAPFMNLSRCCVAHGSSLAARSTQCNSPVVLRPTNQPINHSINSDTDVSVFAAPELGGQPIPRMTFRNARVGACVRARAHMCCASVRVCLCVRLSACPWSSPPLA